MTSTLPTPALLALRSELGRLERQQKRASKQAAQTAAPKPQKAIKPQRETDLEGIDTSDFGLGSAHARLREAVLDGKYAVGPHAIGHARAEGFLEHDITSVLSYGRVRAVYPQERRWLVCGYFEACRVKLPLHVVVEHHHDGWLDVVTAFVPKNPHHIISRARLAVMLRYDDEQVRGRRAQVGNKVGYRSKGKWR